MMMRLYVLAVVLMGAASAVKEEDLVTLVNRGDAETLLQRVGHGTLPDEANSEGQLALVASGVRPVRTQYSLCAGAWWQAQEDSELARIDGSSNVALITNTTS
jgi:hypothetical protein